MAGINNNGTDNGFGPLNIDVNNNGAYNITGGVREFNGNLTSTTGKGQVNILTRGTLQVDKIVSGNTITFADNTGVMIIENLGAVASTVRINGLQSGDAIQIPALPSGFKESYLNGKLVISNPGSLGGAPLGTLIFGGTAPSLSVIQNSVVACFASGTRIATPDGFRAVEALAVGGKVRLQKGGEGEIEWVGRRHLDCQNHPAPEKVRPFRIAAHAFGLNQPSRDLLLSPDHAVFVDGVLIPVKFLGNGTTIRQLKVREVTYHHIELRDHAIVQAEGLSVETLLPGSDKTAFATKDRVVQLHPDFSLRNWEALGCAPLVVFGAPLDAVRRRLGRRAAAIGPWQRRRAS